MRQTIREFVKIVVDTFSVQEPIYEFGAFQVPGQENIANLRTLFPGLEFVGADMRNGPGVDKILNLHDVDIPSELIGTVICVDTLEHVEYPRRAMEEIYRVLQPGGIAIISSVMNFQIHEYPFDYWRFTPEAFRSLLKPFEFSFVGFAGQDNFPHTIVGIGFKGVDRDLTCFLEKYNKWKNDQIIQPPHNSIKKIIKSFVPPIFLHLFLRLFKHVNR